MAQTKSATFAAGCFWGVENYFNKHFKQGLLSSEVGYCGGESADPNYRQVCTGTTGHAEAVKFEYDPEKLNYGDMVEYFYRIHDPTTPNRQGNDQGTQYRSAIFYHDDEQKRIAEEKTAELQKTRIKSKIATEIVPEAQWFTAEEYHQKYLDKQPGGYCNHRERW
ncbi:g7196 [Coccomyxa viridis]|uniref:peptide-methionine (S)-S-oxide reductase n=1 Tax=Coccomyxa viridis TaxID=1274662 RepID=A0ABP1FX83_9CHLO